MCVCVRERERENDRMRVRKREREGPYTNTVFPSLDKGRDKETGEREM